MIHNKAKLTTYKTIINLQHFTKRKKSYQNQCSELQYTVQGHPQTDEMAYPDSQLQRKVMSSTIVLL